MISLFNLHRIPMNSSDIRKQRDIFWTSKQHSFLKPVSLVATKDSTALFNVAGMQQLIPFLSGKKHPQGKRLYNIQGCVRTNDIEGIGDERHLSYFEMMGNRSLGDYFKQDAITWSIEFLTQHLGISMNRIGATIFAGSEKHSIARDTISYDLLEKAGILHITALGFDEHDDSDNFWIAGSSGPCGPCCEFYIDRGIEGEVYIDPVSGESMQSDWNLGKNDRYIEVWNNVFMEFYKNTDGSLTQLPQQNVDTGMGFERISMILQNKETIFETDIFETIIKNIEIFLGIEYPAYKKTGSQQSESDKMLIRSFRIITDHVRGSTMLLKDGVLPSNGGRGYVLRRLIRRMYSHMQKILSTYTNARNQSGDVLSTFFTDAIHSIDTDATNVVDILVKSCLQYQDTMNKNWPLISRAITSSSQTPSRQISGKFAFECHDTYGIEIEILQEYAAEANVSVDINEYTKAMNDARILSRSATKKKFSKGTDRSAYISDITPTQYLGYTTSDISTMVLLKDFVVDDQRILVFDTTIFYAEGGGEIADTGTLTLDSGEQVSVVDVQKSGGVFLHIIE